MTRPFDETPQRLSESGLSILSRLGIIEPRRATRTLELVWPRVLTGLARVSQRVADLVMVGVALGPAAIAGLALANAYWQVGNVLGLGLSGGTISQVSRAHGGDDADGVDRAVVGSAAVGLVLALPVSLALWFGAGPLLGLLGGGDRSIGFGATYLRIMALGVGFMFLNKVASRALVGVGDARIPMYVRGVGAVLNLGLNALFVFGLGLGVAGAAMGTVLSLALVSAVFVTGFVAGRLPFVGAVPIRVRPGRSDLDRDQLSELFDLSAPLVARRLVPVLAVFPLLGVAARFGPSIVAAVEVGRRVRSLSNAPTWGFSLASSSLVGQQLGDGDEGTARAYAREIVRLSTVVYLLTAALVFALARPIAAVFVDGPGAIADTVPFVRVAAIGVVGLGLDGTATGVLRGSGDTRWPFYAKLTYALAIPLALLGAPVLGVTVLYVALLAETLLPATVTLYRFFTYRWMAAGRDCTAA